MGHPSPRMHNRAQPCPATLPQCVGHVVCAGQSPIRGMCFGIGLHSEIREYATGQSRLTPSPTGSGNPYNNPPLILAFPVTVPASPKAPAFGSPPPASLPSSRREKGPGFRQCTRVLQYTLCIPVDPAPEGAGLLIRLLEQQRGTFYELLAWNRGLAVKRWGCRCNRIDCTLYRYTSPGIGNGLTHHR